MPNRDNPIGRGIQQARARAGLTQPQLAALVGVTPITISYWEIGHRYPSRDNLIRTAEALHVTTSDLVGDTKEVPA